MPPSPFTSLPQFDDPAGPSYVVWQVLHRFLRRVLNTVSRTIEIRVIGHLAQLGFQCPVSIVESTHVGGASTENCYSRTWLTALTTDHDSSWLHGQLLVSLGTTTQI